MATSKIPYEGIIVKSKPFSGRTNGQGNIYDVVSDGTTIIAAETDNVNTIAVPFKRTSIHFFNAYTHSPAEAANVDVSGTLYYV